MILAIDIGNTNIVIGCIDGKKCLFVERLSTVRTKTELEYAFDVKNVLDIYHIKSGIISSVVPQITTVAKLAVEKILKKEVLVVGAGIKTGLNIRIDNPAQLGSDLVVDSVAGITEYPVPESIIRRSSEVILWLIPWQASPNIRCRSLFLTWERRILSA